MTARCRRGEATTGDRAVVKLLARGALVAGIDGLGHGPEAARAAARAAEVVRNSASEDLVTLLSRCHLALRETRGAAISLAFLSPAAGEMSWLGVGSVEGRVLSADPAPMSPKGSLALYAGLPGRELPEVRATTVDLQAGDVLVLATDGIQSVFADALDISGSAQAISERILARHRKHRDDALAVAVRCLSSRAFDRGAR